MASHGAVPDADRCLQGRPSRSSSNAAGLGERCFLSFTCKKDSLLSAATYGRAFSHFVHHYASLYVVSNAYWRFLRIDFVLRTCVPFDNTSIPFVGQYRLSISPVCIARTIGG